MCDQPAAPASGTAKQRRSTGRQEQDDIDEHADEHCVCAQSQASHAMALTNVWRRSGLWLDRIASGYMWVCHDWPVASVSAGWSAESWTSHEAIALAVETDRMLPISVGLPG
jgi:hypothetical protein